MLMCPLGREKKDRVCFDILPKEFSFLSLLTLSSHSSGVSMTTPFISLFWDLTYSSVSHCLLHVPHSLPRGFYSFLHVSHPPPLMCLTHHFMCLPPSHVFFTHSSMCLTHFPVYLTLSSTYHLQSSPVCLTYSFLSHSLS